MCYIHPRYSGIFSGFFVISKCWSIPGQSKIEISPILVATLIYEVQGLFEVFWLVLNTEFSKDDLPTDVFPIKITDLPSLTGKSWDYNCFQ